jgi:hypothetical protein
MVEPTFAASVDLVCPLGERFWPQEAARPHRGHPLVYQQKALIVCFVVMLQRRLLRCRAQRRWLKRHPERRHVLGCDEGPHRTTLSRRDKALYDVVQAFVALCGHDGEARNPRLTSQDLSTDKRLCKAQGPVWPQSDRKAGCLPEKLRHLDPDASWTGVPQAGFCEGEAPDRAWPNLVTLSIPKGERQQGTQTWPKHQRGPLYSTSKASYFAKRAGALSTSEQLAGSLASFSARR